jgi:hypothetical protein
LTAAVRGARGRSGRDKETASASRTKKHHWLHTDRNERGPVCVPIDIQVDPQPRRQHRQLVDRQPHHGAGIGSIRCRGRPRPVLQPRLRLWSGCWWAARTFPARPVQGFCPSLPHVRQSGLIRQAQLHEKDLAPGLWPFSKPRDLSRAESRACGARGDRTCHGCRRRKFSAGPGRRATRPPGPQYAAAHFDEGMGSCAISFLSASASTHARASPSRRPIA